MKMPIISVCAQINPGKMDPCPGGCLGYFSRAETLLLTWMPQGLVYGYLGAGFCSLLPCGQCSLLYESFPLVSKHTINSDSPIQANMYQIPKLPRLLPTKQKHHHSSPSNFSPLSLHCLHFMPSLPLQGHQQLWHLVNI